MGGFLGKKSSIRYAPIPLVNKILFPGCHRPAELNQGDHWTVLDESGPDESAKLLWVPSKCHGSGQYADDKIPIPVLMVEPVEVESALPYTFVYFHGNAEALEDAMAMACAISRRFNCLVLAMEYPGYGVTQPWFSGTDPKTVNIWVDTLCEFIIDNLKIKAEHLIPFGRSIGSGPAGRMASLIRERSKNENAPFALILNAPYKSIAAIATEMVGVAAYFAGNPWDNSEVVAHLSAGGNSATTLAVLHGEVDEIIPVEHGRDLASSYQGNVVEHFPLNKGHNDFDLEDFISPIEKVLENTSSGTMQRAPEYLLDVGRSCEPFRQLPHLFKKKRNSTSKRIRSGCNG